MQREDLFAGEQVEVEPHVEEGFSRIDEKVADFLRSALDAQISNPTLFLLNQGHQELVKHMDTAMWLPVEKVFEKLVKKLDQGLSLEKFRKLLPLIGSLQLKGDRLRHLSFCAFNVNVQGKGTTTFKVLKRVIELAYPHCKEVGVI